MVSPPWNPWFATGSGRGERQLGFRGLLEGKVKGWVDLDLIDEVQLTFQSKAASFSRRDKIHQASKAGKPTINSRALLASESANP